MEMFSWQPGSILELKIGQNDEMLARVSSEHWRTSTSGECSGAMNSAEMDQDYQKEPFPAISWPDFFLSGLCFASKWSELYLYAISTSIYDRNLRLKHDTTLNFLRNGHLTSPQIHWHLYLFSLSMTSDPRARRFRYKIHLIVSYLGFVSPKTDQKCKIYVFFKKNLPSNLVRSYLKLSYLLKIGKSTVVNQFFELDN